MNFFANIIKRPVSIVSRVDLDTTPEENSSGPSSCETVKRSQTPLTNLVARAMNTSLSMNACDPDFDIDVIQQDSDMSLTSSSDNTSSYQISDTSTINSSTKNTIEELLIEINDNLNNVTNLADDEEVAQISSKSPSNTISPMKRHSCGILRQTPNSAEAAAGPAVFEKYSTLNKFYIDTDLDKEGLFEDKSSEDSPKVILAPKFSGITGFDETQIPDLADNFNPNVEDPLGLTFDEGLIPTLTANTKIDFHSTAADAGNNIDSPQMVTANELELVITSDSDVYDECQSELESNCVPFSFRLQRDLSDLETFRSALENNVSGQSASGDEDANSTLENIPLIPEDGTGGHESPLTESNESVKIVEPSPLLPLPSYGDAATMCEVEPMDVDMSFTEASLPQELSTATEKSLDVASRLQQTVDSGVVANFPETAEISKAHTDDGDGDGDKLNIVQAPPGNPEAAPVAVAVSEQNEEECIFKGTSMALNAELTPEEPSAVSAESASGDTEQKTLTPVEIQNVSDEEKPKSTESTVSTVSCAQSNLIVTVDVTKAPGDGKSSAPASPTFPIRQSVNETKQFPRSPTSLLKTSNAFLEKSDYAEKENVRVTAEIPPPLSPTIPINFTAASPPEKKLTDTPATGDAVDFVPKYNESPLNGTFNAESPATPRCHDATFDAQVAMTMTPEAPSADFEQSEKEKRRTFNAIPEQLQVTTEIPQLLESSISPRCNDIANATFDAKAVETTTPDALSVEIEQSEKGKRLTFNVNNEDIDEKKSDVDKRLTFNMNNDNRRTFNVPQEDQMNQSYEPMDVDVSMRDVMSEGITAEQLSPPIPTLLKKKVMEETSNENPFRRAPSPPIPTLRTTPMPEETKFRDHSPPSSVFPPPPTVQSPPVPALAKRQNVNLEFEMSTQFPIRYSPAEPPVVSMRPPIHETSPSLPSSSSNSTFIQCKMPIEEDVLSFKEQSNMNSKDEKDIVVDECEQGAFPFATAPEEFEIGGAINDQESEEQKIFDNDDFHTNANANANDLFLNPSDFDYLLTKGNDNVQVDRNSVLLRFDPLLGVPVPVNQPQEKQQQQLQQLLAASKGSSSNNNNNNNNYNTNQSSLTSSLIIEEETIEKPVSEPFTSIANKKSAKAPTDQRPKDQETIADATMSVDVINDMNIENDCKKSYENSNLQSDDKHNNYKMDELEKKIKNEVLKTEDIEKKLKEAEQREESLIKRITEKDKTINKMNGIVEEYEKAIAELIAGKEQLVQSYEKQLAEVKADRDSNYQHLTSLETTFSDLHIKYEKSKEMTAQLKAHEESILSERRQTLENLRLQEQRYVKMKNHALQQLEIANKKIEAQTKDHSMEITKLKALLKKEEISRASMSEQLEQKARENAELVKICDELINSGQGS